MDDPFKFVLNKIDDAERIKQTQAKSGRIGRSAFESVIRQSDYKVYHRGGSRMINFEGVFFKLDNKIDRWAVVIEQYYGKHEDKWEESEKQFAEFAGYPVQSMDLQHEDIFG